MVCRIAIGLLVLLVFRFPGIVSAQDDSAVPFESAIVIGEVIDGPIPLTNSFVLEYFYFGAQDDDAWTVGLITNIGEDPTPAARLEVHGLDENGFEYGSYWTVDANSLMVGPGESVVISGGVPDDPGIDALHSVRIEASEGIVYWITGTNEVAVEGIPTEGRTADIAGKQATIRNVSDRPLEAGVVVNYFGPDGVALGYCTSYSRPIPPGKHLRIEVDDPMSACGNARRGVVTFGLSPTDDKSYRVIPFVKAP